MDARRLGMLADLARLGTIAAVAEHLHLTAPGVSMQLSALEREAGVRLTERRGRRLELTPAGRLLAHHGGRVLDQLALADMELDAVRRGAAGLYRVAAFPSAARTFVASTWASLARDAQGISLELTTPEPEDALSAVRHGDADLAVIHGYSNVPREVPPELQHEALGSEAVRLAVREDHPAAAYPVRLADLAHHDWITAAPGLTCTEMTMRACGLAGFRPTVVAESIDFATQLHLVAAGVGVALIPSLAVDSLPAGVRLVQTDIPVMRHIGAAWRRSMSSDPGVGALVRLMRQEASAMLTDPTSVES